MLIQTQSAFPSHTPFLISEVNVKHNMATEYELTLHDYLLIFRHRAPYLIGIFVVVLLISIAVAIVTPPTYRATGTIMVESPQVSENFLSNAIRSQLDVRINTIMQQVMTRESLLQIADKYSLFKENTSPTRTDELIEQMRKRIVVEPVSSSDAIVTNQRGQPTISFTISFEARSPEVALQVDKDLISIFLSRNIKMRNQGAAATTDFLSKEAEALRLEVDRMEKKITAYKQQNKDALPEQLTLRMTMLSRAENDLQEVERDYRSTKEDIRTLSVELAAAKQGIGDTTQQETLPALKAQYEKLSAIYTDAYPDLRILKRKIDAMEQTSATPASGIDAIDSSNLAEYKIQAKIASDNARLSSLEQQRKILQDKIAENENAMIKTPKVEQGLDVLTRDRDTVQAKYEELRNKQMNAQMAQTLESENKSETFTLLEPPILPQKPFKPNRLKILMLGFLLAIVSSGGTIMTWETIDKRVRGTEALAHVLGYRPLVVIPYIFIPDEEERKKRLRKLAIKAAVVALITALVAILWARFRLG